MIDETGELYGGWRGDRIFPLLSIISIWSSKGDHSLTHLQEKRETILIYYNNMIKRKKK